MSFYIRIDDDRVIELPNDIDVDERIKLCEKVISEYPEYFEQCLPIGSNSNACDKVKSRLNVMGQYILSGLEKDKNDSHPILTNYKEKRNLIHEIPFSTIEHMYDDCI